MFIKHKYFAFTVDKSIDKKISVCYNYLLRPGGRGKHLTIPIKAAISGKETNMSKKSRRGNGNGTSDAAMAAELAAMQERGAVAVAEEPEAPETSEATLTVKEAGYGEDNVSLEMFQAGGLPVVCSTVNDDGTVNQEATTIVPIAVEISNALMDKVFLDIGKVAIANGINDGEVVVRRGRSTTQIVAPADMPGMVEPILIGTAKIRGMSRGSLGKRFMPLTPSINKNLMDKECGEFSHTTVLESGFGQRFVKVTVIHFADGRLGINLEQWKCGVGYRREEEVNPETGEPTGRQVLVGPYYWEKPDGEPIFVEGQNLKRQAAVALLGGKDPDEISDDSPDAINKSRLQRRLRGLIYRLGQIIDASFTEAGRAGFKKPHRDRQFGSSLEDNPMLAAARKAAQLATRK